MLGGMNSPKKLKDVRFFCCRNKAGLVGLVETTVRQVNFAKVAQSFQGWLCFVNHNAHGKAGSV